MSDHTPLEKLRALCPMRSRDVTFGDHTLTLWTAEDTDPLLDRLIGLDPADLDLKDERMPYWAELWPSSFLLAEVIVNHYPKLPEGDFLELGCGPALPGIMAATLGKEGTVTDYMKEAQWLAEANVGENGIQDRVRVRHLDWREPPDEQVTWILAGDVAYESRNFRPILDCWQSMLQPGGQIWLGEPGRAVSKAFFQHMETDGWHYEVIGRKERIKVYRITRTSS